MIKLKKRVAGPYILHPKDLSWERGYDESLGGARSYFIARRCTSRYHREIQEVTIYYPDARRSHESMMEAMRALRFKEFKHFGRTPTIRDDCYEVQDALLTRWWGDKTKWIKIRKMVEEMYASSNS